MNLGEFRNKTRDLPDNTEIVATPGDATWWEVEIDDIIPATITDPAIVSLSEGQEVTESYDIPVRLGIE